MSASRSAEDLLCVPSKLRNSKSSVTLVESKVTTCPEYSEVWEPEVTRVSKPEVDDSRVNCQSESVGQDSGISSTSDSTVSYSNKRDNLLLEDLTKVPWYEAEMPR